MFFDTRHLSAAALGAVREGDVGLWQGGAQHGCGDSVAAETPSRLQLHWNFAALGEECAAGLFAEFMRVSG